MQEMIRRRTPLKPTVFRQFAQFVRGKATAHSQQVPISTENGLCSMSFRCPHTPGALQNAIGLFNGHGLNLRRIESRPSRANGQFYEIFVDVEATAEDPRVQNLVKSSNVDGIEIKGAKAVPWFPMCVSDLDKFATETLDAGEELESDHPGFSDMEYRKRRAAIVANAKGYKFGTKIPRVDYSDKETQTWGEVYKELKNLGTQFACREYNAIMPLMEANCGYAEDNIPQLQDISEYLTKVTGFRLRPVAGLLSARDFLNALAFRTFFSTQYIRHYSSPFYTPEPDVCHELLGHVPMLLDKNFADFSQHIGLASLGASEADIKRLATCYWFSVEFGILKENGANKAYGAGLLSSFGELSYSCSGKKDKDGNPKMLKWDPAVAAETEYPITTFQPKYFVAESLESAKHEMKEFCENEISRPFNVTYDALTASVIVDRNVTPTLRDLKEVADE